jgi:AhpD family alkylhydroperoxidase
MTSPRIPMVDPGDFDPALRQALADRPDDELGHFRIYAHLPGASQAFLTFLEAVRTESKLPPRTIELVRLRLAYLNQCPHCIAGRDPAAVAAGMSQEMVCSLETPGAPSDLTAAERAAVRYASLLATDHLAISDELYAGLRDYFSDAQVVALGYLAGVFLGIQRVTSSWAITEGLPDEYRDTEPGNYSLSFGSVTYRTGVPNHPAVTRI